MDQFTRLPKWGQFVVVLLVCALIFGAAWYGFLSGQRDTMQSRLRQVDELDAKIRQGREAQKRVDELNRQIDLIRRDLEVLKSIIPTDPETGQLLRVFQTFAREQNLDIYRISPQPIQKKDLYSEQAYGMQVGGGYHDLAMFFDKIAHMRRIVNITNLSMSASSKPGETISAQFNSLVYMQNPEAFSALEKKP
ncbi:MAG: type 4a pilus biogenesis protein PilO [Acidobacteriota bacterium]|jgi:type IV pilus assembly protein PilO